VGLVRPLANCVSMKLAGKVAALSWTGAAMLSANKNSTTVNKWKRADVLEIPKPKGERTARERYRSETLDRIVIPPNKG
jgi:hypothetical protein